MRLVALNVLVDTATINAARSLAALDAAEEFGSTPDKVEAAVMTVRRCTNWRLPVYVCVSACA